MIRVFKACVAAGVLALSAAPAMAAEPPLAAYGALPAVENVALSASGSKLALITVAGEQRRLVMQEITGEPIGVIEIGDSKIRDLIWAGDEHLVIVTTKTTSMPEYGIPKYEWIIAQSYSLKKKRVINLGSRAMDSLNTLYTWPAIREIDGRWYAFVVTFNLIRPIIELQRVTLDDGTTEPIDKLGRDGERWLVDANGVPQARARYNSVTGFWSLGARKGAIWPDIYQVDAPLDSPSLMGFGRDGRTLLILENGEDGSQYLEIDPQSGRSQEILGDDRYYERPLFDPASGKAIGAIYFDGETTRYLFFESADQAAWEKVQKAFKGQRVNLDTWSRDRQKVVVRVDGSASSGMLYLVDLAGKRADIIGEVYPGVPADQVAEVRPYSYKAADGLTIPAFLTLPPGRDPKGLPLIVLAHGGPEGHDLASFDYQAQALASRGYAVLQANFRGSDGYALSHLQAGYGEWGRKMQTDLSDGVRALVADGLVNPKRVCIMGGSYGGYAAAAGVTLEQGVYRCAVAVAAVTDLRDFLKWRDSRTDGETEGQRYWRRFMGVEKDRDPVLDTLSPTRNAARADAPILLIHGRDDTVVPYSQSADFADALRKAGKPVELVTLTGEDHWLSRSATRQQMLETAVNFLLRENPPR